MGRSKAPAVVYTSAVEHNCGSWMQELTRALIQFQPASLIQFALVQTNLTLFFLGLLDHSLFPMTTQGCSLTMTSVKPTDHKLYCHEHDTN